MFDVTVGNVKKFELLPDEQWILARIKSREVIYWSEEQNKYVTTTDDVLKKLCEKLRLTQDDETANTVVRNQIRGFQFQFSFKPLESKKFANYVVRYNTGIFMNFETDEGEFAPNKLAKFFLGAGGLQPKSGTKVDVDDILGNYVAIQVENTKGKNNKVYQKVNAVRELTDDELIRAKSVEQDIAKIEKALQEQEEKTTGQDYTQTPILEQTTNPKDTVF